MLGILVMNAVSFALPDNAYFRLDAGGWATGPDRVVGVLGEVFFDQKMMALFSLLFGASVVLFIERVGARRRHPVWLSLWRNVLLLGMGLAHTVLWNGDVLLLYALCSPLVLLLRRLPPRVLLILGGVMFATTAGLALLVQRRVNAGSPDDLGFLWVSPDPSSGAGYVVGWMILDGFLRALGMMLIGIALYRTGFLAGRAERATYRRVAVGGLAVGLPLAVAAVIVTLASGFSSDLALVGTAVNTLATPLMGVGYGAAVLWWTTKPGAARPALRRRLDAVGRMALTNYLSQTVMGLLVFRVLLDRGELGRATILLIVVAMWAVQLWWSPRWLARFTNGPVEWLWRTATYLRRQPLRRRADVGGEP